MNPPSSMSFEVGVSDGRVIIAFPEPTTWIGLTTEEARELAHGLLLKVAEIEG